MKYFLVVLYGLILTMAMCTFIVQDDIDRDLAKTDKTVKKKPFVEVLFETFTVMFGENPAFADVKLTKPALVMYLISTNIINIICLNILISIVTDNYAGINAMVISYDAKKKADLLLCNEKMYLLSDKGVEESGTPKYLFHISYYN